MPAIPQGEGEVRLLFELQPENTDYYFVGVRRGGLRLGKVECGVEVCLAEWGSSNPPAEPPFGKAQRVTVSRKPGRISVAVANERVIEVSDDTFVQGRAAIGVRGLPASPCPDVRVQATGGIYAADDFMRTREEEAGWRAVSGDWAVEALKNPGLSANAFVYSGRASKSGPAAAILGETWWDDYSFEVSCRPVGTKGLGLLFRYVNARNHYAFRQAAEPSGSFLQLVRVKDGQEMVLCRKQGSLSPNQWYRLRVTACGGLLAAAVDGRAVFEVCDTGLAFGMIGLCVAEGEGAEFDDVFVRGERGVAEKFSTGRIVWYAKGGTWSIDQVAGVPRLRAEGPPKSVAVRSGKLIGGDETWGDYRVATVVAAGSTGRVGIVGRYRDESEYDEFAYDVDGGKYELALVRDGLRRVVCEERAKPLASPRVLSVNLLGGVIVCEADGVRVLSHFDDGVAAGKAGLFVGAGAVGVFENVFVAFPVETEPVLTQLDTFAAEKTMENWAGAESDWRRSKTDVWGKTCEVYWHRAAFPGAFGELRAGGFFDSSRKEALHLFACCDISSDGARNTVTGGYEFVVRTPGVASGRGAAVLFRNGKVAASGELDPLLGKREVGLRKVADHVVAEVDGRAVLVFKDPSPLAGWSAGYAADDVSIKPDDLSVFCENTVSYSFVRAACDWRTAGGEWQVMNRWRCDPRWSFFGGESLGGVAAIWNKIRFGGDMAFEFTAAIRHPGGKYEPFARDINAVICGDGSSLASGYGFLCGGWDNTKTAITRNGKVVAECGYKITGDIHRRWFCFKVVKQGGNLKYYVDDKLVLAYDDPEPLPDGQVGLWTWRNGMMVAKVRIAAERIGPLERFEAAPRGVSKCHYDH